MTTVTFAKPSQNSLACATNHGFQERAVGNSLHQDRCRTLGRDRVHDVDPHHQSRNCRQAPLSKIAILAAFLLALVLGILWLKLFGAASSGGSQEARAQPYKDGPGSGAAGDPDTGGGQGQGRRRGIGYGTLQGVIGRTQVRQVRFEED